MSTPAIVVLGIVGVLALALIVKLTFGRAASMQARFLTYAFEGNVAGLRAALERGVDVNHTDAEGYTALMAAARQGKAEAVHFLIQSKAKLDLRPKNGESIIGMAARKGSVATVKVLLAAGFSASEGLQDAILYGSVHGVETMALAGADVNAPIEDPKSQAAYKTPLILAAEYGDAAVALALVHKGADIDATTPAGRTPLMTAAMKGHVEVVRRLLDAGADADLKDVNNQTALSLAQKSGLFPVVFVIQEKKKQNSPKAK